MRFANNRIDPKAAALAGDHAGADRPEPFTLEPKSIAFYGPAGELIATKTPPADYVREVIRHRFGSAPTPAQIQQGYECIGEDAATCVLGAVRFEIVEAQPDHDPTPFPRGLSSIGGQDDD